MSANVETMAYNKAQTPWHGLGNPVESNMTVEQMLTAAGLDWTVSRRVVKMTKTKGTEEQMMIPGYLAIVRDSDNKVFQIASERYKPIQNVEVMEFFREYAEAGEMNLETAGALDGGAIVWSLAKVNDSFTLAGGDKTQAYMLLANSHDGSVSFTAKFTSVRVVCCNTLSMALASKGNQFRMKHSKKFTGDVAKDAKEKLGIARKNIRQLGEVAEMLSQAKVDNHGQLVREYILRLTNPELLDDMITAQGTPLVTSTKVDLDALIDSTYAVNRISAASSKVVKGKISEEDLGRVGRAVLDSILNSPGSDMQSSKGTWWGVVNGVTHYVDHEAGRTDDTRMQSAWFGLGDKMKNQALMTAVEMVGAGKRD